MIKTPTDNTFKLGFLNSTLPQMNSYLYLYGRTYEFNNEGIAFQGGYSHDTASHTATAGDNNCVPLVIYGVKGVMS